MAFEYNEKDKTWKDGGMLVREGKGAGGKAIYHCYRDGKYVAQASSLEEAKAKCRPPAKKD